MVLGQLDRYMKKNETRPPSYTPHMNKFKWIKDLHVRHETIKILGENKGSKISDIAHRNILLDISFQARGTKEKINKWDNIKLKTFCTAKEIINKIKRQPTEGKNIFSHTSDKALISKMYKVLTKHKKIKQPN